MSWRRVAARVADRRDSLFAYTAGVASLTGAGIWFAGDLLRELPEVWLISGVVWLFAAAALEWVHVQRDELDEAMERHQELLDALEEDTPRNE